MLAGSNGKHTQLVRYSLVLSKSQRWWFIEAVRWLLTCLLRFWLTISFSWYAKFRSPNPRSLLAAFIAISLKLHLPLKNLHMEPSADEHRPLSGRCVPLDLVTAILIHVVSFHRWFDPVEYHINHTLCRFLRLFWGTVPSSRSFTPESRI